MVWRLLGGSQKAVLHRRFPALCVCSGRGWGPALSSGLKPIGTFQPQMDSPVCFVGCVVDPSGRRRRMRDRRPELCGGGLGEGGMRWGEVVC